jgi:superfamily I DNA/RNA helicase
LQLLYPQYRQGTRYSDLLKAICAELWANYEANGADWTSALSALEGENSVPVMTIHKSKGLEYHTVIFLGLEDSSFWTFESESAEETCSFFVAFSRAKKQVIFTFSKLRSVNERYPNQARTKIKPLYDLLREAGVTETPFN